MRPIPVTAIFVPKTLALCLALSACQTTTPQSSLDAMRATYDASFLVSAVAYRTLPSCAPGVKATVAAPCADPATVLKLRAADKAVAAAFASVQAEISSGNATPGDAAFAAAQAALTAAASILATTQGK